MRACAVLIPAGLASRWAKFLSAVVTQKPWGSWSVCHLLKIASALLIPRRSIHDVQVYLHSHTLSEHLPTRSRLQVPQRTRLYDHPWLEDFQSQDTWQNHQNKEKSRKVLRWFSSATAQMPWKKLGLKCPQQIDCLQFNLLPSSSLHQKLTNHKKLGGQKKEKKRTLANLTFCQIRESAEI